MTADLNIINGNLFLRDGFRQGCISIEGERILKIGKEPSLPTASKKINVNGSLVIPGIIDIHVHLRDLTQQYKETMETGTRAAVAGGVTTVIDMPNNKPPTDSVAKVNIKKQLIKGKAAANIGFYSLIPNVKEEIVQLKDAGIFGFKIYPNSEIYPPKNIKELLLKMHEITKTNLPLIIHPDSGFSEEYEKKCYSSETNKIEAFIKAHNKIEEANALEDFIKLNKQVKGKLHCAHVTARETVDKIINTKTSEKITAEICPHYLILNSEDLFKLKSEAKCLPPLRTKEDQKALWRALNNDIINFIASDHAPHSFEEKHCDFEVAASGISGLETLLPTMLTSANLGKISFEKVLTKLTVKPAKYLGLTDRGEIKEKNFADITVIKKEKNIINSENFISKAKWSPLNGFNSDFTIFQVYVNGTLACENNQIPMKMQCGKILEKN